MPPNTTRRDAPRELTSLGWRTHQLEANNPAPAPEQLNGWDVGSRVNAHGRTSVLNAETGNMEFRFSERASFSIPDIGSSWNLGESGPWPILAGYVGSIWAVALGLRVASAGTDIIVEFNLNGFTYHTLTLPHGQILVVYPSDTTKVLSGIKATTGAMSDWLSVNLVQAAADAYDLTAYAKTI